MLNTTSVVLSDTKLWSYPDGKQKEYDLFKNTNGMDSNGYIKMIDDFFFFSLDTHLLGFWRIVMNNQKTILLRRSSFKNYFLKQFSPP